MLPYDCYGCDNLKVQKDAILQTQETMYYSTVKANLIAYLLPRRHTGILLHISPCLSDRHTVGLVLIV